MFLGHYAVAFSGKKVDRHLNLGTLIFAAQFLDLIWPFFLLVGFESVKVIPGATPFLRLDLHDYPISHSLLMALFWSVIFGSLYFLKNKQFKNAFIVGCVVFSHWVLDFISHTPDMPLIPYLKVYVGLGLWNSTIGTIVIEAGIFILGVFLYLRATAAKNLIGKFTLWSLILFLSFSYLMSILSPPPQESSPIAYMTLAQWIFIPWGYWIDKNRIPKNS